MFEDGCSGDILPINEFSAKSCDIEFRSESASSAVAAKGLECSGGLKFDRVR